MLVKEKIGWLKQFMKHVNANMHNFLRIYEKVFQMNPYGYDVFVNLDLETEKLYHDLIKFNLEEKLDAELLPEVIQKKWNHILNSKKTAVEDFKDENFDAFFWSYILVEIYIVMPYFLMAFRIMVQEDKHHNWDKYRAKKHLAWTTTPIDLYQTNQVFKRWDFLDQQSAKIAIDVGQNPPLCHVSYGELNKTFSNLFNYYYLVLEDDLIVRTILRNIYLGKKAPWLIGTIILFLILGLGLGFGLHIHK